MSDSMHELMFGQTIAWREQAQEREDESLIKAIEEIEEEENNG